MRITNENGTAGQGPVEVEEHTSSFCVSLQADGRAVRIVNRPLGEYLAIAGSSNLVWIDYSVKDLEKEIKAIASSLGFDQIPVEQLISQHNSSYEDCDSELGVMLPAVKVAGLNITVYKLVVLIRGNLILTIHDEDIFRLDRLSRYAPTVMRKMAMQPTTDNITLLLERIIDENNERNAEYLREIDAHSESIIKSLTSDIKDKRPVAYDIYNAKRVLIAYLDVFWATKDVIAYLRNGDADLITDDERILDRIGVLSTNVDQYLSLAEQTSDALSSGYSILQNVQGNLLQEMNNKIALVAAYMTVIGSVIFVPNTLATVLSSINSSAGRLWWYTPLVAISTMGSTIIAFLWVLSIQRKKDD